MTYALDGVMAMRHYHNPCYRSSPVINKPLCVDGNLAYAYANDCRRGNAAFVKRMMATVNDCSIQTNNFRMTMSYVRQL